MSNPANIPIGSKFRYGGQDPGAKGGVSYSSSGTVEIGDLVAPTNTGATVARPAAGQPFMGEVISKERDGGVGVRTNLIHVARATGAITPGLQKLAADGNGGVQAGGTVPCNVLGTENRDGQAYVAFHVVAGF